MSFPLLFAFFSSEPSPPANDIGCRGSTLAAGREAERGLRVRKKFSGGDRRRGSVFGHMRGAKNVYLQGIDRALFGNDFMAHFRGLCAETDGFYWLILSETQLKRY